MTCPSEDDLLRLQLRELTVAHAQTLEAHAESCTTCGERRAGVARLLSDLAAPGTPSLAHTGAGSQDEAFIRRVVAAAAATDRGTPDARSRSSFARPAAAAAGLVAVAAAALLALPLRSRPLAPDARATKDTITARGGGASRAATASAAVLLLADQQLHSIAGRTLDLDSVFAVRATNLTGRPLYLMAFARDAAGDVHWLYPAYHDEREDPSAVAIDTGTRDRLLDEVVQPQAPARGPMQVVTLLSDVPLTVHAVERSLLGRDASTDLQALFAPARVTTWSVSWGEPR